MNFDDTPQEALFRKEIRAWIKDHAPKQYLEDLESSPVGTVQIRGIDGMAASKAWQKRKADAGWACLQWPKEFGGRGSTPIERVIWTQEEGTYAKLSRPFGIGQGMCGPICPRSHQVKKSGASCFPSLQVAPTSPACARVPSAMATTG